MNESLARLLVEVGSFKPNVLSRSEFTVKVDALQALQRAKMFKERKLKTACVDLSHSKILSAIAEREASIVSGEVASVLFLLTTNSKNQKVSGYIDLNEWLGRSDSLDVLNGKTHITPTTKDLSFLNWSTGYQAGTGMSASFEAFSDRGALEFKCKIDEGILSTRNGADINNLQGEAESAVFFDHKLNMEISEYLTKIKNTN